MKGSPGIFMVFSFLNEELFGTPQSSKPSLKPVSFGFYHLFTFGYLQCKG